MRMAQPTLVPKHTKDTAVEKPRQFDEANTEAIHGSYWPMDLRRDSGILATIRPRLADAAQTSFTTPLWRISPLGAEYAVEDDTKPFKIGEFLDITVSFRNQTVAFFAVVVSDSPSSVGKRLIGMRWLENESTPQAGQTRRETKRWICSTNFLPTAVAPNPVMFNDLLLFRVADVSKTGARLITSMRNKFILPNMAFEGTFTFPMIGSTSGRFRVKWTDLVSMNGKQELALGVELDRPTRELSRLMGEYVLQFGDAATVKDIRESGLVVKSTGRAIDISYMRTEKEYHEVMELRQIAYQMYKTDGGEIPELSDIFDSRARIIMARHRNKVVGSTRIIYHELNDALEQAQYGKLPDNLPRNDEMVEMTRNCTHPDYRSSDLLYEILRHALIAVIQAKRRFVMSSSPDHLLPFYLKMGMKDLNIVTSPKSCPELKLHVLIGDLQNCLKGVNVNPFMWSFVYEDLLKYAVEIGYLELDTLTKIRLTLFRALKPIGRIMMKIRDKKFAS